MLITPSGTGNGVGTGVGLGVGLGVGEGVAVAEGDAIAEDPVPVPAGSAVFVLHGSVVSVGEFSGCALLPQATSRVPTTALRQAMSKSLFIS